mmetsp:Transcript_73306/g.143400  ORF Transcript_73306/g.143400 Transcript_73306/m.143400 type:complete len:327 (-) Transcript_73306:665-1645(-)
MLSLGLFLGVGHGLHDNFDCWDARRELVVVDAVNVVLHQAANVGAGDAEAGVRALHRRLEGRELNGHGGGHAVAVDRAVEVELGFHHFRDGGVAHGEAREHCLGKDVAFRQLFHAALQLLELVRVPHEALDHRDRHERDDGVLGLYEGRALALLELREPLAEQGHNRAVDFGDAAAAHKVRRAVRVGVRDRARAVVLATLLGQAVEQDAGAVAPRLGALEAARVESHGLVPRHGRAVVAVDAGGVAVVDRVLHLANRVHPHVEVRRAFLRALDARRGRRDAEVLSPSAGSGEGTRHEIVAVRWRAPVVRGERLVINLANHLGRGAR